MPSERAKSMEPSDDILLGVLNLAGGSGTSKSIQSIYEREANKQQILRDVPDDAQEVELSTIDVNRRLWLLHDLGLVDYLGHGEFSITEQGQNYFKGEGDLDLPSGEIGLRNKLSQEVARRGTGIVAAILSIFGFVLFIRTIIPDVCELGIGTSLIALFILPVTLVLVLLHILDVAKPFNVFLIKNLSIIKNGGQGGGRMSVGDIDESAAAISNAFRSYTVLGLCVLLAAATLFATKFSLNTQVYGLIFDLFGGVFLAFQAIHASRGQLRSSGKDLGTHDYGAETIEVTDGIWGIFFLIFGFSIQGLAQIRWVEVFNALFGTVPGLC